MRILLMEDNHRLSNSLKMHLAHEGYSVDTAYDGPEGQHIWKYDFECESNVIGLSLLSLSCIRGSFSNNAAPGSGEE